MMVKLDIRKTDEDSFYFFFDRLFISDIHWGTKHSNAHELNIFLDLIKSRKLSLGGDIIDVAKMQRKWRLADPEYQAHRDGIGKIFQLAYTGCNVDYKPGNHDIPLRGKTVDHGGKQKPKNNLFEKDIYNVTIKDQEVFTGTDNRVALHLHGDQFDSEIAKTENRGFWYNFFDKAYTIIQEIDWCLNKISVPSRIGPWIKKKFKDTINKHMDYYSRLDEAAKNAGAQIVIHGHSHNMGFEKTKSGILKIDDGCATDHVQALGQMKDGTYVLMEMKDGEIRFEDEHGHKRTVNLEKMAKKMGCTDYINTLPRPIPETYLVMANNALRPLYRMSPPKDHRNALEKLRADQDNLITLYRKIAEEFNLDASLADKPRSIAMDEIFKAVHTLPESTIREHWNKISNIYALTASIDNAQNELRRIPIQKSRLPLDKDENNTQATALG